jgi:hypothetical protein
MRDDVKWTYLSAGEITAKLADAGFPLHDQTVRKVVDELGYRQRRAEKRITMGHFPHRDEQFQIIAAVKGEFFDSDHDPIFSIDAKKKEFIGNFHRPGHLWGTSSLQTLDHDFHTAGQGRVVPHGIYDVKRNTGHITLGLSHETSQFACDSFALFWERHGRKHYPRAKRMLWLCDCGGSNNARHYIFKEDLQKLVNKVGIPIRVAHYPPYCSKYNPIEHRMFPHVTRCCQGVIFHTLDIIKRMLKRTWTRSGLSVTVGVISKAYATARQASDRFLQNYPLEHHKQLPELNYTVSPAA